MPCCLNISLRLYISSPTRSHPTQIMAATHPWINKWPENLDFSNQSVQVPGTRRPGQTSKRWHIPCLRFLPAHTAFSLKVPTEAVRKSLSLQHAKNSIPAPPPAPFPYFTLNEIEHFRTLPQLFDRGILAAGSEAQFLGHRPVQSQHPLTFANHFVWQTWGEIDKRRKNVGSALQGLFNSGAAVGTNGLDTVGIWSANNPGK